MGVNMAKGDSAGTIAALTDLRSELEIRSSANRVDRLVADSGGGDIQGSAPAKSKRFDDLFTRTTFAYHLESLHSLSYLFREPYGLRTKYFVRMLDYRRQAP